MPFSLLVRKRDSPDDGGDVGMIGRQLVDRFALLVEGVHAEPCGLPLDASLAVFEAAVRVGRQPWCFGTDEKPGRTVSQTGDADWRKYLAIGKERHRRHPFVSELLDAYFRARDQKSVMPTSRATCRMKSTCRSTRV